MTMRSLFHDPEITTWKKIVVTTVTHDPRTDCSGSSPSITLLAEILSCCVVYVARQEVCGATEEFPLASVTS